MLYFKPSYTTILVGFLADRHVSSAGLLVALLTSQAALAYIFLSPWPTPFFHEHGRKLVLPGRSLLIINTQGYWTTCCLQSLSLGLLSQFMVLLTNSWMIDKTSTSINTHVLGLEATCILPSVSNREQD